MDIFAEIEIAQEPKKTPQTPIAQAQSIGGGAADPIRQKFYDMRGMASDNPYTWNDARLFYRQAKFMENFSDDYENIAEFSMHYPCFQRMGYERLRTYFTWRAKARRGEFNPVGLSYVFLYVYELLSCVGAGNPTNALKTLISLRNAYAETFPALDDYLLPWLRDFFIYYEMPQTFGDFIVENNLHGYNETFTFGAESNLAEWNKFSSYDIEKSKFYTANAENAELLSDCFNAAVRGISSLCEMKNSRLKDLFVLTGQQEIPWVPFRRALFHPWLVQPNRRVALGDEIFNCNHNKWTTLYAAPYAHRKDLTGFIIKKTEACVRDAAAFKTKIFADPASLYKARTALQERGVTAAEIENVIDTAVSEFFKEKNRVVVNVDRKNIERIREEAQDITDKLVVEETEKNDNVPLPRAAWASGSASAERPATNIGGEWEAFMQLLNDIEIEALKLIIAENGDLNKIKTFADGKGVMLEILVDNINEKAMDTIGDNMMELSDIIEIYEEYAVHIQTGK